MKRLDMDDYPEHLLLVTKRYVLATARPRGRVGHVS